MQNQEEINVPPYFLCPISMDIMRDPVTISTGITYDRESIEKWVFTNDNTTCPVTKQQLNIDTIESFLTPNHTLRRLIQSWCTINASYGIERFPTPKPPATKAQIVKLINEASRSSSSPKHLIKCLCKIKSIASESNANKRCLETTPGVPEFLARVIIQSQNLCGDEALSIFSNLQISDEFILRNILKMSEGSFIDSLVRIMQKSSYESRKYAISIMKKLIQVADPTQLVALKLECFVEIVQLIKDDVSPKVTKTALNVLALACPWGRNRVTVVEARAVSLMVDILLDSKDRKTSEMAFEVLDQLSCCPEGRAELLAHAAGLAVVSKKILRVSQFATARGVRILFAIAKFSGSHSVVQEMLQLGVVTKLCLVLQVDVDEKTKEKAREILRMHSKSWRNSPCAPASVFGYSFN